MLTILREFNIDIEHLIRLLNFNPGDMLHLPFFYIFGRSDGTVSIDGANIYPADIEELIADNEKLNNQISSFIMKVSDNHHLGFDFELKQGQEPPTNPTDFIRDFRDLLAKYSSNFKELVQEDLQSSYLKIEFYPFGTGPFAESPLVSTRFIKNRYIRR